VLQGATRVIMARPTLKAELVEVTDLPKRLEEAMDLPKRPEEVTVHIASQSLRIETRNTERVAVIGPAVGMDTTRAAGATTTMDIGAAGTGTAVEEIMAMVIAATVTTEAASMKSTKVMKVEVTATKTPKKRMELKDLTSTTTKTKRRTEATDTK
jgi:hypothetical protein